MGNKDKAHFASQLEDRSRTDAIRTYAGGLGCLSLFTCFLEAMSAWHRSVFKRHASTEAWQKNMALLVNRSSPSAYVSLWVRTKLKDGQDGRIGIITVTATHILVKFWKKLFLQIVVFTTLLTKSTLKLLKGYNKIVFTSVVIVIWIKTRFCKLK